MARKRITLPLFFVFEVYLYLFPQGDTVGKLQGLTALGNGSNRVGHLVKERPEFN